MDSLMNQDLPEFMQDLISSINDSARQTQIKIPSNRGFYEKKYVCPYPDDANETNTKYSVRKMPIWPNH